MYAEVSEQVWYRTLCRGKGRKSGFSSWSMHMFSIRLNLQWHGAGTRSGARTCVGGPQPILVTGPVPNDRQESLLCSGVWEKCKGSCGYEAVPVKLLCGQEVSPIYDLEQITWCLSTCLNFSTLNATAVYTRRFYKEVCQLPKADITVLILQFHCHAVDLGHWQCYQANWKFVVGLLGWHWSNTSTNFRKWVVTQTAWILPTHLWVAHANLYPLFFRATD